MAHPRADWTERGECCVWMQWPVGARSPGSPEGGPTRGNALHAVLHLWEWWSPPGGTGVAHVGFLGPVGALASALSLRIAATASIFSFLRRHTPTPGLVLEDIEQFFVNYC